jgi:hypothetical protein
LAVFAGDARFFRGERPDLVQVDDFAVGGLLGVMETTHADFTEVAGMVSVEIGAVVMKTTGHTATSGMFAVLSHTAMTS